ncbi:hypothetical protein LEM8419_01745 [Neolewinella maritima]|uniref:Right handed beta helix domain-containing protein n=1 Tax=Neolewinella maritima TaxID=1383882 RepID=A0ABN8F1I5_9BACT|nr:parallel beta-helix domain-containing protein [Neolewinella maritima]CAH1000611.1 hypothetical protein LEM8419_01745 [Neolewinella maritima]
MRRLPLLLTAAALLVLAIWYFAADGRPGSYDPVRDYQDRSEELLTQFILAEDSSTIELPAGHFLLDKSLSLDGRTAVTIRGQGIDQTVLSFQGQTEGAEGLRISNSRDIVLEDFTVEDAAGDNIKVMDTDGITFRRVKVAWTGAIDDENGAYGFYPVLCTNVLIEDCVAMGASDAGVYVGQSQDVVVRGNEVYQNVAGIESENSSRVQIYDNHCYDNTGGILVFNLPGLTRYGNGVEVFNNKVIDNNRRNFGVKGSIVSTIPAGTGMLVLATKDVAIHGNQLRDHGTLQVGIISYDLVDGMNGGEPATALPDDSGLRAVETNYRDIAAYDPYPANIRLYNNTYSNDRWLPKLGSDFGKLFLTKLGPNIPDVAYDGIWPADREAPQAAVCVEEDADILYVNLDAGNDFAGWTTTRPDASCRVK